MTKAVKQKKSWKFGDLTCEAHTRSEARAIFRRQMGGIPLPPKAEIYRVEKSDQE